MPFLKRAPSLAPRLRPPSLGGHFLKWGWKSDRDVAVAQLVEHRARPVAVGPKGTRFNPRRARFRVQIEERLLQLGLARAARCIFRKSRGAQTELKLSSGGAQTKLEFNANRAQTELNLNSV